MLGTFWNLETSILSDEQRRGIASGQFDVIEKSAPTGGKIFLVTFDETGQSFRLSEIDLSTRWIGKEDSFRIESPAKTVDMLFQSMLDRFSPVCKLEKATLDNAFFRVRGTELAPISLQRDSPFVFPRPAAVLVPFVRLLDQEGQILDVKMIPSTALVVESIDPTTDLVRCRIESAVHGPLTIRRRGRTDIMALAVPSPLSATKIQCQARGKDGMKSGSFLPRYDVFEQIPGQKIPVLLGQTTTEGSFLLEPAPDKAVRLLLLRSGRTLLTRFPVVRGLESELTIPIPDEPIRLEAEGAVVGMQEDFLDQIARRSILEARLKKANEKNDASQVREIRNEIARLKDKDRFLMEIEQARLRFRSDDPVVQRRIDRLFSELKKTIETGPY